MRLTCAHLQDIWSIGCALYVAVTTPSNNCQESWHRTIMDNLKGQLRGSTEAVIGHSLPRLMTIDALNMADTLVFSVRKKCSRIRSEWLQMLTKCL